jgi:nitrite reductase/ring-hydroxylating ferredoxin subunit
MEGFVKVATVGELQAARGLSLRIEGEDIALFRVNGEVLAVRNNCPHQHFSLLHQGALNEYALTCPMHGWTFDLRTGKAILGSGNLTCYRVKVIGEDVWIEQPQSARNGEWPHGL